MPKVEKAPTWQRLRRYLPPTGPEKAGVLPSATAGPTRSVQRNAPEGTNPKEIPRPAQGGWKQDISIPEPVQQ